MTWGDFVRSYSGKPANYQRSWEAVKKVLMDTFFGSPPTGVYSPSVQHTLYQMAKAVLVRYDTTEHSVFQIVIFFQYVAT